VIADGTPSELKNRAGRDIVEVHVRTATDLLAAADALRTVASDDPLVDADTRRISVPGSAGSEQLVSAVRALDDAGVVVDDLSLRRPTLDEVFLELTGTVLDSNHTEWHSA
jgi:ABC-2 type transport system ATP-binding protein